jgi:hypothetical protein
MFDAFYGNMPGDEACTVRSRVLVAIPMYTNDNYVSGELEEGI